MVKVGQKVGELCNKLDDTTGFLNLVPNGPTISVWTFRDIRNTALTQLSSTQIELLQ